MASKLKKCPFCGKGDAIAAWNRRADHIVDANKNAEPTFTKEELKYILILAQQIPHIFIAPNYLAGIKTKCEAALKGSCYENGK